MHAFPLTALEEYMLCDDRPAFPMTGIVRLRFSGFLEKAAWEATVNTATERHALLRTTVQQQKGRRLYWIDQPDWRPKVHWHAPANAWGFPSAGYIDLKQQPGTRFWVVQRDDGHDVVLQVHHAGADATGLSRLMEDLLVAYAQRVGSDKGVTPLCELDTASFRQRGAPGLTTGRFLKMLPQQAVGLLGVREFLARKPSQLAGPAAAIEMSVPPPEYPTPSRHELSHDETRGFLQAAKARGVTANDLLVRDLFLAVTRWRQEQGLGNAEDWLRFSIPMNLRRKEDHRMPVANSVSSVFLDRRPADCADADQLLGNIRQQMQKIKRLNLQYTFVLSLGLARMLPGGLTARMRTDDCQLTTYVSNIGPVLQTVPLPRRDGKIVSGNVVLDSVDYVIPLRPFVNASFCIYTYADRLSVLMHPDLRVLSPDVAKALHDEFLQQLRQSAAG